MSDLVVDFYDRMSVEYHHNMGFNWEESVRDEGAVLHQFLLRHLGKPGPFTVLDCTCGIGTQAIGLALQGHSVHAADISPVSIECARRHARNFDVFLSFSTSDFRDLGRSIPGTFDVVISCDNAIAHCLVDDDLDSALGSMKTKLAPNGLLLLSTREYDNIVVDKPRFTSEHVEDRTDGRRVVFQLRDWIENENQYHAHQFLIKSVDGEYTLKHFETMHRAILRDELMTAIDAADYGDAQWHSAESTGYYQPIVTARNPSSEEI